MKKQTLLISRPLCQHAQVYHRHAQIQRTLHLNQQMWDLKQQVITTMYRIISKHSYSTSHSVDYSQVLLVQKLGLKKCLDIARDMSLVHSRGGRSFQMKGPVTANARH